MGLKALELPRAVYYSLVSFVSSVAAAIGDGPLHVRDILALGSGLVIGLAVAWYWDEKKGSKRVTVPNHGKN